MSVKWDYSHQCIVELGYHSISCVCEDCLDADRQLVWATRLGDCKITFDRPPTSVSPAVARVYVG